MFMRHARMGACISAPHGFVWAPRLHLSHYAATVDWLISGSFHSPRLPIFRYGFSGDFFALLMRLVIWPLLDSPAVTENRRGLGNCDFGMGQILVWPAANWSRIVLETWREEAEPFEHLDAQPATEITEARMSDLGLQVPEEG